MLQNGDVLGGMYRILGEIGQGGTGIIYLAEHLRLQKRVVVKKVKDHFVGQVNGRAEVDILKKLHHSCLPQVYDFLVIGSSIYTVMEYVEGRDLQQLLDQGYHFPEALLRDWFLRLSEVLEYLHGQKPPILHSDIKPANLMLTARGEIYLIDFNISLDGENTKELQGISQWYASPEQFEKAENVRYGRKDSIILDGRMDIYSLGAVFYRIMTGQLPSAGQQTPYDILNMDIPYSEGLKAVVSKAMRRNPAARFQTARQLSRALRDVGRMDPLYRWYQRLQIGIAAVWAGCLILGGLLLYYGVWQDRIERWQAAYGELYVAAESEDDIRIVSKATEILNSYRYQGYLEEHTDKHAEVLHVLGDSYFRQLQFGQAAAYYREAWEMLPEAGGYCKDYVIALVRDGQQSQAVQVMESAEGLSDLSMEEQCLIRAELDWMEKDADGALKELEALSGEAEGADPELLVNACILQSDIYEEQEEYSLAVAALERARELSVSREVLRRLGQAAVRAASASDRAVAADQFLSKALDCYQALNRLEEPSYEDRLNLALTERAMGEYQESTRLLKEVARSYPQEYAPAMWIAYNCLSIAGEKGSYESVKEDLNYYYNSSRHEYDASAKSDEDMEELIGIMRKLEEKIK